MRLVVFLLLQFFFWRLPLVAQWFSFGVKGGLPLTATSDSGREVGRYGGQTSFRLKRYTVGPTVELDLRWGLRLEADALYKHARQDRFSGPAPNATLNQQGTRMGIWEIPLMLKYPFPRRTLQPFATAGISLRRVEDLDIDLISIPTFPNFPATRQRFAVSTGEPLRYGLSVGGGLRWNVKFMRLEPELRYTHWTAHRWMSTTEQVEFLLGVAFPVGRAEAEPR